MNIRTYIANKFGIGKTDKAVTPPGTLDNFQGLSRMIGFGLYGSAMPQWLNFGTASDYPKAWEQCPPLVSVICGKASADMNGKIGFVYTPDNDGKEEKVNISKVPAARSLARLFSKPNPLQTWRQFRAQQKIYTQLFGFCPVLMVRPLGFNNRVDTKCMWNIPPHLISVKLSGKVYNQSAVTEIIESIELNFAGNTTPLPVDDVVFLKDSYLSLYQEIIPESRIKSLVFPISNVVVAYEASNVLMNKHGALGILSTASASKDSFGPVAITEQEKQQLQKDFEQYGLKDNQWQFIITTAALQWQQMALPVKDLMLFETIADATRQICDVYGYYYELLSKEQGDTFSNKREAKASLYMDTIIPEAEADFEVYNHYFDLTATNMRMLYDFSHVEVLQKSEKEAAETRKITAEAAKVMYETNVITLNRMREMMGEKTKAGDDVYYSERAAEQQANNEQNQPGNEQGKADTDKA